MIKNELRGCIGYVEPFLPLQDTVSEMALSAAFDDPRFPSLSADEFEFIEIEISILTPKEKVLDISDVIIGKDGLIVIQGYHEGLLLPQVAKEYNWDIETFLAHTCMKAGLSQEAWKEENTKIYRFSALIFKESEYDLQYPID
jgi:AmmeMemoRadiSam system protein A